MYLLKHAIVLALTFSLLAVSVSAQQKPTQPATPAAVTKDVDPLALDVLRAVAKPVEKAQSFTFKALVGEEELATDGQVVTFFHTVDITVQRPDKIHLVFRGRGQRVDYYGGDGSITMFSPDANFYTTMPAKSTIDANLTDLNAKGVDMPIAPFLRSKSPGLDAGAGKRRREQENRRQ